MNVFELDEALVNDYERFARSFTLIRAPDIRTHVEALYAGDRFWPEPLISINPRFERGASIDQLAGAGSLREATVGRLTHARPLRRGEYFVNALDQQPQPPAEIAGRILKPISSISGFAQ
jgi:hypothetical protein